MKLDNDLVVFDLETTGAWIEKDKIIEIAMVKRTVSGTEHVYDKRICPGIAIPAVITELTGISDADVKDAPVFKDVAREVRDFIGDSDIAGFNVERFDLPLLTREMNEAGLEFRWKDRTIFDAQKIYHINEKRDLTAAYKFFCQKDLDNAHSALADTRATLAIIEAQIKKYGEGSEAISSLSVFDYKKRAEFYDSERKFRWWNGKLYMMFGKYAKHYSLQEIAQKDAGYLQWVLSANFSDDVKDLVQNALNGEFPEPDTEEAVSESTTPNNSTKDNGSEAQMDLF